MSTLHPTDSFCGITPQTIHIDTIRCFSDNNCFVLRDSTNHITIVDPAEPESVIKGLLQLGIDLSQPEIQQNTIILTTHHHWDHAGGNEYFSQHFKSLKDIYGGAHDEIPCATKLLENGETFTHGEYTFVGHHTPCHTKGHICYFFHKTPLQNAQNDNVVEYGIFTGDTLFSAGCGKFFEGNAEEMFKNMTLFTSLPPETFVYDGHEYTKSNLTYVQRCEPGNGEIKKQLDWVNSHPNIKTHPSTLALERKINTFMRVKDPQTLHLLRQAKNNGQAFVVEDDHKRPALL